MSTHLLSVGVKPYTSDAAKSKISPHRSIMASMRTTAKTTANNKQNQPTKTPFCAFCFNLGKPAAIYNSHYIRETPAKDSRIICPELKSCKCMGCGKQGHTISNCNLALDLRPTPNTPNASEPNGPSAWVKSTNKDHRMGENQKQGIDAPYKNRHYQNPTKPHQIQPKNIYSLLTEDDENSDDEDETATMVSEISHTNASIASSATTENDISIKSYAAALMSVLHPKQPQLTIPRIQPTTEPTTTYDFSIFRTTKRYASWADAESSDDEE